MGASTDTDVGYGTDVRQVFNDLQSQAAWEHGHGGYSGTIAEAAGYRVIPGPTVTLDEALDRANAMIEADDRRIEKWGPALAIGAFSGERTVQVTLDRYTHDHGYDAAVCQRNEETLNALALDAARAKRLTRRGEKVSHVQVVAYRTEQNHGGSYGYSRATTEVRTHVQATVTLKAPAAALTRSRVATARPDTWVFVGCYSS